MMHAVRTFKTARPWILALALAAPLLAGANPSPGVQQEVDHLLAYVENSGCEFYRNGTWSDAKAAHAHIQTKFDYLVGRDKIVTAQDFIANAASESSLSGIPYQVRCGLKPPVLSRLWLSEELARFRERR